MAQHSELLSFQLAYVLSLLSDLKEREVLAHGHRVAQYAREVFKAFGIEDQNLYYVSLFLDIGKLVVPDIILYSPTKIVEEERKLSMRHTIESEKIIASIPILRRYAKFVRWHHERYNGSGFPDGLKGDEIPLEAQILGICDAYAALTEPKPQRKSYTSQEAIKILESERGIKWNPEVADKALKIFKEFKIKDKVPVDINLWEEIKRDYRPSTGRLVALYRIADAIGQIMEFDDFLNLVLESVMEAIRKPEAHYFILIPDDEGKLVVRATIGGKEEIIMGFRLPIGRGLSSYVLKSGKAIFINDVTKDKRFYPTPGDQVGSAMAVPLVFKNEILGVVVIESPEKDAFSADDFEFIKLVSATLAGALKVAKMVKMIKDLAFYDYLTKVHTFAYFEEKFREIKKLAEREGLRFSIVFMDFDNLKQINDGFGHFVGDRALEKFGLFLKENLRESDVVARYGGDEFVAMLIGASATEAKQVMERLKHLFKEEVLIVNGHKLELDFSYGISEYKVDSSELQDLIKIADSRMYMMKRKSKESSDNQ
ncbi:MAG: hypothetical protein DRQ03_05230 [Candidatus Hydrothermota bacterium]|nr:MAG: hypothetical protein DRQ03_05230 [Candidatus Hydrothermae bacterium]